MPAIEFIIVFTSLVRAIEDIEDYPIFKMANEKMDANQERAFNSSNPSPRPEADFCELVWENGQVMMQGQSSKTRKGNFSTNDFQSLHNPQDGRDMNGLKTSKFSSMDSLFGEMGLGQDVDMPPWLSYPVEDDLDDDYTCDFLPELSGITINDFSTDSHLALFRGKKSDGLVSTKGASSSAKHDVPRSGVSGVTGDNVGNIQNVASQGLNASSLCAFTSLRLQKLDSGQPSTSSSFTNFPHFSRSAAIAKGNHGTFNTSKKSEIGEQRCNVTCSVAADSTLVNLASACSQKEIGSHNQSVQAPFNGIPGPLLSKPAEELVSTKRVLREEDGMNDTQQNHVFDATRGKMVMEGEGNKEPIVAASSVCSGNSVDRVSNERTYDLKRKSRDTTESEGPSEEAEEESVGAKRAAHARASSKRSRAAEVHNLSERKRRDRINEKMRSLQELIPNCNKVDKASMLDEAIEYLKTLQLQVQMLSMGTGMYMQPMMFPPGMQPAYGPQMPHFSPMGLGMGMGMGMGFGMNMLDMNNGMKMSPFPGPHYPVPGTPSPFQGMPAHHGQGLQMPMQQAAPLHPNQGVRPLNTPVGLNVSSVAGSSGTSNVVPSSNANDSAQQVRPGNIPKTSMNQVTNQATKEGIQPSPSSHDRRQNANASESSLAASKANNIWHR